ncbi:SDR family NAD(P)-dependent oxidoreductase [Actinospica sp.]|jgi:NAD(P)-dependent dehydrogenase (short-subunit alcohol dehydrogenase family)|uniref:SDR family NAD(P)-dependent oxidoreductase n=1 Tax=Actinospica sp. TaxID=1872142 RepID=UPI002D013CC3|nr:SDR family NAD(P)-dependent oxidoreductase [Actinospica sp.]HWG23443.1 SDR family NAD(P)-dependent oxidoreductase [Actinospica sp.]
MDLRLVGRRALVTGSSSGIGAEIARMLGREGVRVVVHGRSIERVQAVASEIAAEGGRAATAIGDLTVETELGNVIAGAEAAFDGIDIVVNNAGGTAVEAAHGLLDTPGDEWLRSYRQNALPAVRLAQALVPPMRERGWGRVIQIASRLAEMPDPEFGPYAAAKAAVRNLTVSLARELAGSGVTANAVAPSMIWTSMAAPWFKQLALEQGSQDPRVGEEYAIKHLFHQPVHRAGRPEDVAAAVCFLASPLADYISGATLRVDGGATPTV